MLLQAVSHSTDDISPLFSLIFSFLRRHWAALGTGVPQIWRHWPALLHCSAASLATLARHWAQQCHRSSGTVH